MAITTLNNRAINRSDTAASGQLWTATSATASDFQAVSAGKILQVVQTEITAATASTTSSTFEDIAGMTVSITPAATSSKIMVIVDVGQGHLGENSAQGKIVRLISGGSDVDLMIGDAASSRPRSTFHFRTPGSAVLQTQSACIIDSPSTTTSTSYRLQWRRSEAGTMYLNRSFTDTDNASHPRGASTITVMEIGA